MKDNGIQWVIDLLGTPLIKKKPRENHKYDAVRADANIKWCPKCEHKWNIYEGEVWKSPDMRLWDEKVCPHCE
jgi:hypothetical protein